LSTPILPDIENVLASLIYIRPASTLEFRPKPVPMGKLWLEGFITGCVYRRLKLKKTGAAETPAKAYRLLFNGRLSCRPTGTEIKLVLPPPKMVPAENPA